MKNPSIQNQKGMSLIEVLMGTMILAIFIMGLTSLITFTADQKKQIVTKVDREVDSIVGERFLFTDLRNATPSMNNITSMDDFNLPFFDYFPDVNPNSFTTKTTRTLTLSAQSPKQLVVLAMDLKDAPGIIYDPTAAYRFTPPPPDFTTSNRPQFVSINQNNYVNNAQRAFMRDRGDFWRDGQIMFFDTPARIRPVINGTISMKTAPRSSIFLGHVRGAQLLPITNIPQLNRYHPKYTPPILVTTADYFLRTIPPVGGSVPIVRLGNVKVLRYSTSPTKGQPGRVDIFRETHNGTTFGNRQVLASGVLQLVFLRESIFQPMISFKLVYNLPGT